MTCNLDSMGSLVKAVSANAHSEGRKIRSSPQRQCGNQAGVEAARQKYTDGHICDDAITNRSEEQLFELINHLCFASAAHRTQWQTPKPINADLTIPGKSMAPGSSLVMPCQPESVPGRYS